MSKRRRLLLEDTNSNQIIGINIGFFNHLIHKINDIASSEESFHHKIAKLYACSVDYESNSKTAFTFSILQNKFLFAATGKVASELIYERANHQKPNMGLTVWKNYPNGKITKTDVLVSKNYLTENELSILNKLVSMIFDYAILQAQRQIPMKISDLEKKINDLLNISNEHSVTPKISTQLAEQHANTEYDKYIISGAKINISKKGNEYIYLRNLSIENLRTFGKRQTITFTDKNNKPYLWNIIIGDNGIGKTSILKALTLPLNIFGNPEWKRYIPLKTFERYKSEEPKVLIDFEFTNDTIKETNTLLTNIWISNGYFESILKNLPLDISERNHKQNLYSKAFFLFAYGASRHIGTKGISTENEFVAQTLFDDSATLINAEEWIIQSEYKAKKEEKNKKYKTYHQRVISIIKALLKDEIFDIKIEIINDTPKVLFETRYGWVNLHELSLGYKTLLSWVIDFAKGMLEKYSESKNPLQEPAICLIDEIDLHIHPALQNKVIKFLSETFTKTQFIVTAHSPLIVQALENANIILLKDKGKSVEVQQNIIDIRNWRIDQILMSDLFGLQDVYSIETQIKLERREYLLRKDSLTENEQVELNQLNEFVDNLPIGNNQNEIEGFALLKQFAEKIAKNQNK